VLPAANKGEKKKRKRRHSLLPQPKSTFR
jgi:hypothetical protein